MDNFRIVCLETYQLDRAWYYTIPSLAWSSMLKKTEVTLDLLTDIDQILMIERSIRGGVSMCTHRYAKANNKYMADYDIEKESSYLLYLDMNNLYGKSLTECLPYSSFKWESDTNIDVRDVPDDAEIGYFLEVDLEYPRSLHDQHSDFPLAPESRTPPGATTPKLLNTFYDKERYVLHYRNLKLYLSLGLKLTEIHRVLSFKQKPG